MLTVVTWIWGLKYGDHYVRKLRAAVARNLKQPHRFLCVTDMARHLPGIETTPIPDADRDLTKIPGCLVRLRMFDPVWQKANGIDGKIVNIDLDAVVTGPLDDLFYGDEFTILQNINTTNPCPYNGSLFMFRAGSHSDLWGDFSREAISHIRYHAFPDDQGWFWHKIPHAAAWTPADGVYGFKKVGWPSGDDLPQGAKVVAFPGWRDPAKFENLDWISKHWR